MFPEPRLFTLDEANALLPTLRPILDDLQRARERLVAAHAQLAERHHGGRGNGHVAPGGDLDRLNDTIQDTERQIGEAVRTIAGLGCELKDPERGMVDFRTRRGGRVVYLCWLRNEPEVLFWHELEGGFAGRQAL